MSSYISNCDQGQVSAYNNHLSSDEVNALFDPELGKDENSSDWTDIAMVINQAYIDEVNLQQPINESQTTPSSSSSPASVFDHFSTPTNAAIYSGAKTSESALLASGVRINKKSEAIAIAHPLAPGCTNGAYYGNKFHKEYCESRYCTASVHDKFAGTAHYAYFFGGVDPGVEFSSSVSEKVVTSSGALTAPENATIEEAVAQTLAREIVVEVLSAQAPEKTPQSQPNSIPTKVLPNAEVPIQQARIVAPAIQSTKAVNSAPKVDKRSNQAQVVLPKAAVKFDYSPVYPCTAAEIQAAGLPQMDIRTSRADFPPRAAANSATVYSSPCISSEDHVAGGQQVNNRVSAARQVHNPEQIAVNAMPHRSTQFSQQIPQNHSLNVHQAPPVQHSFDTQHQQLFQHLQRNPELYGQILQQIGLANVQQAQTSLQSQQIEPMNLQQVQRTQQFQHDCQMPKVQEMQNTTDRPSQAPIQQNTSNFNANFVQQSVNPNFNHQASIDRPRTRLNASVTPQTPTPVQTRAMSQGQASVSQSINRAHVNQQAFAPQGASSLQNGSVPPHDLYSPLRSRAGRSIDDTTPLSDQEVGYRLKYGGLGKPLIRVPLDFPDDADPTPYARPESQNALGIQVKCGSAQPRGRSHQCNSSSVSISQISRGARPQTSVSASRTLTRCSTPSGDPSSVALGPVHPMAQSVAYNHLVPRVSTHDDSEDEGGNDSFFDLYSNKAVPLVEEPQLPVAPLRGLRAPTQVPTRAVVRLPVRAPAQGRASLKALMHAPIQTSVYAPIQAPTQGSGQVYSQATVQLSMLSTPSGPSHKRSRSENSNNEVQTHKRQFTPRQQQLANISEEQNKDEDDLIMLSAPPTDQSIFKYAHQSEFVQQASAQPQFYSQALQKQQSLQPVSQQQQFIQRAPQQGQFLFQCGASQAQTFSQASQQQQSFQQVPQQTQSLGEASQLEQPFQQDASQTQFFGKNSQQEQSSQQVSHQLQFSSESPEQQNSSQKAQSFSQVSEQEQVSSRTSHRNSPFAELTSPDDLDPFVAEWLQGYIDGKFDGQGFGN